MTGPSFVPLPFRRLAPADTIERGRESTRRAAQLRGRMPPEWREALRPLGTDEQKPHLTDAPSIVIAFRQLYGLGPDGESAPFTAPRSRPASPSPAES